MFVGYRQIFVPFIFSFQPIFKEMLLNDKRIIIFLHSLDLNTQPGLLCENALSSSLCLG
ncbi:hypothetical protein HMPREF0971_00677 [Segatella oris F0302]|uniref:Uncharacterized protein n=1 Tax=Segatella oris F0302 TaxID=649760 RepID=D1QNW7_9BACT|nr:hypothetical protein HMPREF0971_00677 [Segatella oris F0302]